MSHAVQLAPSSTNDIIQEARKTLVHANYRLTDSTLPGFVIWSRGWFSVSCSPFQGKGSSEALLFFLSALLGVLFLLKRSFAYTINCLLGLVPRMIPVLSQYLYRQQPKRWWNPPESFPQVSVRIPRLEILSCKEDLPLKNDTVTPCLVIVHKVDAPLCNFIVRVLSSGSIVCCFSSCLVHLISRRT